MKTITATELKSILDQHRLWVETNRVQGTRACLTGANLTGAYLAFANLKGANLTDADLTDADLTDADLNCASLEGANLTRADLTGTILDEKAEIPSVNAESTIRSEFEAIAKKFGLQITCLEFKLI
jgi:uncharacterized protein YjbI with pentapeptide repeats